MNIGLDRLGGGEEGLVNGRKLRAVPTRVRTALRRSQEELEMKLKKLKVNPANYWLKMEEHVHKAVVDILQS